MTTTACSKARGFWNGVYFLGELKRSWANALLYAIAFFFTMTVPMMMEVGSFLDRDKMYAVQVSHFMALPLLVVVAMAVGFWAACSATGHLMRRTSSYYFYSLPLRREGMILVKSAVACVDFAAALLVNLLLSGVMLLRVLMYLEDPVVFFGNALYVVLAFAVVFALVQLLAMLCGTRTFHLILCVLSGALGPAWLGMLDVIAENVTRLLRTPVLSDESIRFTSPYAYLAYYTGDGPWGLPLAGWIGCAVFALLCFGGTLLLARVRPAEGAESSVVFAPVGCVVKYLVMVPATFFMGYLFEELGGGLWLFFGVVSGAVLCFMLMNVLISRSARNMFRGAAWLLLYGLLFMVGIFGTGAWYGYIDYHAYPTGQIASVEVEAVGYYGGDYTLTSPEAVEATSAFLDEFLALARTDNSRASIFNPLAAFSDARPTESGYAIIEKGSASIDFYDEYDVESLKAVASVNSLMRSVRITETTRLGFSRTWTVNVDRYPELYDYLEAMNRAIADSDEFAEQYLEYFLGIAEYQHDIQYEIKEAISKEQQNDALFNQIVIRPQDYGYVDPNSPAFAAALDELRAQLCYDFFQQTQVLSIWVNGKMNGEHYSFRMPIYASQNKMLDYLGLADGETLIELYADAFRRDVLTGYTVSDGEVVVADTVTDAQTSAIYRGAASISFTRYGTDPFFLTGIDPRCFFRGDGNDIFFLADKLPDAVVELFRGGK